MDLSARIESVLFWKGEPVSLKKLADILKQTEDEIRRSLTELEEKLKNRGVQLVYKEDEVMLGTQKELSPLIEQLTKEELIKDLGKAGLETLTIIMYRGPVARRDIDYIRGVNSNFILRNLLIRGLVEKVQNPSDQRSFLYKPTFELLQHLGISKLEELPGYTDVQREISTHHEQTQDIERAPEGGHSESVQ